LPYCENSTIEPVRAEFVRGTSVQAPLAVDEPRLVDEESEETEEQVESVLRRKFDMSGPNLKQELQLLVKEDPDAAASILRNWIGDAA